MSEPCVTTALAFTVEGVPYTVSCRVVLPVLDHVAFQSAPPIIVESVSGNKSVLLQSVFLFCNCSIGATVGAPTNMVSYLRVVPQSFTIESVMITLPLPTGVTIAIGLPLLSCPVVTVAIVGSEL